MLIECSEAREALRPGARVWTHNCRALLENQLPLPDVSCGNEDPPWKQNDCHGDLGLLSLTQIASDDHLEGVTLSVTVLVDDLVPVAHAHITRHTHLDSVMIQADETLGIGVL